YPDGLQYRSYGTTCNNSRTMGCGLDINPGTTEFTFLFMGQGPFVQRYPDQILLCILYCLGYSGSHLLGFSKTLADHTIFITDNNDGRKAKCPTTLGYLGYPLD